MTIEMMGPKYPSEQHWVEVPDFGLKLSYEGNPVKIIAVRTELSWMGQPMVMVEGHGPVSAYLVKIGEYKWNCRLPYLADHPDFRLYGWERGKTHHDWRYLGDLERLALEVP